MIWHKLSLLISIWPIWSIIWAPIITILILFPVFWYIDAAYIKGLTLLYETGITFIFFWGLAGISILIWRIGIFIKSKKNHPEN